ncbi:MAG: lipoprotein-releasing system permease protein [Acidobacteriota bacterium]|nr:lipoprotein-releasing system permease protein [Acidobacteriota bacterium]
MARWTALAAVFGIACGVAALTLALALANGFRDELRDKILRGTAHVTLSRAGGATLEDAPGVAARVRRVEGVRDAAPTTYEGALLGGPNGASYTLLRGVDAASARARAEVRSTLTVGALDTLFREGARGVSDATREVELETQARSRLDTQARRGSPDASQESSDASRESSDASQTEAPAPVVLGEELAARTGLTRVGDEGWLLLGASVPASRGEVTPGGAEKTTRDAAAGTTQSDAAVATAQSSEDVAARGASGFVPRARRVRVAGLFRSGLYDYDSAWTYASLAEVGRLTGGTPASTVVSIEARDMDESASVARRVRETLGAGWSTLDWREANRPLFAALALERRTVALIIMLITVVAALNITTTLALVVVERRADIAVLVALGARERSVTLIFMIEGALVGAVGAFAGAAAGLAACLAADRFRLVRLPPDVYALSAVPLHPHAPDVILAVLAAFAVSLLATLYPARQAARVRPAEALRYE